ncbi:hypothetical protein V1T75_15960 [Tenacibaculum sp. FZY0031]|uniref:hypothetical protein n=1 Tax=Tenacibaculum sp. FZY0031 TaxID=3116648 RepID=UPI002EBFF14F|nr:hypothetical protein [Tenacibaculum sp. FZY0031]
MLKNISNLGAVLNKQEQQTINGKGGISCPPGYCLNWSGGCTHLASAIFDDCAS